MAELPTSIRHNQLLNQLVLNRSTMEELGRIEVLWMYPPAHRVLGFVCKAGFLGNKKLAFKLSQVEAIGVNGILTHSPPDETDTERVRQLESIIQCEVWSNAGHKLGKIVDCEFNLRSGVITDYLLVSDRLSALAGSIYRLPPAKIVSLGRRRVLVAERSIQEFTAYGEGIPQKLSKVSAVLKDDYEQVTQELRSLGRRAQETTQQRTTQFKTLAEQARERAQILAEQAKERAQELNEQLLENAQSLAERARETSETLAERVQSKAQEWSDLDGDPPRARYEAEDDRDLNDDLDDDPFDFDFDDEDTPRRASNPEPPVVPLAKEDDDRRASQPSETQSGDRPPNPVASQTVTAEWIDPVTPPDEDVWTIDDPVWDTERGGQNATYADEAWDLDEDPWNITEPPNDEATPPGVAQPAIEQPTASQQDQEDEPWV